MKKLLLILVISNLVLQSFGQIPLSTFNSKNRLLQNSNNDKTAAIALVTIGTFALAGGISLYNRSTRLKDAVTSSRCVTSRNVRYDLLHL